MNTVELPENIDLMEDVGHSLGEHIVLMMPAVPRVDGVDGLMIIVHTMKNIEMMEDVGHNIHSEAFLVNVLLEFVVLEMDGAEPAMITVVDKAFFLNPLYC